MAITASFVQGAKVAEASFGPKLTWAFEATLLLPTG